MWDDLLAATALLLVIEGILPFISPQRFREALIQAAGFSDRAMRIMGLASMLLGLVFLYVIRH
jgi:uncharacterized protein YjeT (DUF2065 family)